MLAAFGPGRVNLIGEHTDYNDGLCLPFAIARGVTVRAEALAGGRVEAHAADLGEDDAFAAAARLRDEQLGRSRFVEHAIELLRHLRGARVRTALLTNGPSWMQRRKVELLGLEAELDAIGISEELGASKPDPAAFTATLELMGSAPADTVMVGDHLDWDVRGALAAGMRGAVWVAGDEDEREPPPGALKVARLGEVPPALAALA